MNIEATEKELQELAEVIDLATSEIEKKRAEYQTKFDALLNFKRADSIQRQRLIFENTIRESLTQVGFPADKIDAEVERLASKTTFNAEV